MSIYKLGQKWPEPEEKPRFQPIPKLGQNLPEPEEKPKFHPREPMVRIFEDQLHELLGEIKEDPREIETARGLIQVTLRDLKKTGLSKSRLRPQTHS